MKMSKTRLYVEKKLSPNIIIYIKDYQLHFLKNVLRIKINESITLFDGLTGEWLSKVISINRNNVVLQISKKIRDLEKESDIWLIFAPIKSFRMNITIQKATELGVSRFIPCITQHTNQQKINNRNLKMNIIESAEQSERLSIPILDKTYKVDELLASFPNDRGLIFCNENQKNLPSIFDEISKFKNKFKKWSILIGPEGGFSEKETNDIKSLKNTISVTLGNRILRSDTATTAAIFSVQSIIEKEL